MTPQDVLIKAAELLESSPSAWIQNRIALDHTGWPVPANSPIACQWCAIGAIAKVQGVSDTSYDPAALRLAGYLQRRSIPDWNDAASRTREDVIAALKAAAV